RLAVFWVWSAEYSLVVAADEAIECVTRMFGQSPVGSYQGLANALCRYSNHLLAVLFARMQRLMQKCDADGFRIGRWFPLAIDGSRLQVPRTVKNQRQFCKPKENAKSRKRSESQKRSKSAVRRKARDNRRPEGSLIWLTLIWHVGQRLPW
ncbi:hypothetical protein OAS39_12135, partial [Pirellulales bacterium]|nr:hypothetical protein [Pirellulales bacterium]